MWNVRLNKLATGASASDTAILPDADSEVRKQQNVIEKVERILKVLSGFEESTAACISEMLVHFTNEEFRNGAIHAKRLVAHVELLLNTLQVIEDKLANTSEPQLTAKPKEAKHLVKKIILFFSTLSEKHEKEESASATKGIIYLVTVLAHLLKITIRHALTGALKLVPLNSIVGAS